MRAVAIGVDAGGTSTKAIATRGGEPLGEATGDAANASALGFDRAAENIAATVAAALGDARADAICVGAAGAGRDEVARGLEAALRARFPGARVAVCDDARIALRAAVPDGDGIVLIAGTGSIAYGEFGDLALRAGGYGYLLGDEGSGFALGSAAAKLLLRSYDGRAVRDAFVEEVERALGVREARDVLELVYRNAHPVGTLAALAPIVLDAAGRGERAAAKIVQAAALDLAELVASIVRRAQARDREVPIVLAGGMLRANSLLSYLLETRLNNDFKTMSVVKNAPAPRDGALLLAQRLLEVS